MTATDPYVTDALHYYATRARPKSPLKNLQLLQLKLNKPSFRSGSLVAKDVTVAVGKSAYRVDPIPLHCLGVGTAPKWSRAGFRPAW